LRESTSRGCSFGRQLWIFSDGAAVKRHSDSALLPLQQRQGVVESDRLPAGSDEM